jgi:oxygen-independent coproporphyrinogen-3 oxidase
MTQDGASATETKTTVGNYFISNYPPFSFWSADQVTAVDALLTRPPTSDVPLGLYVHIPFCRKRCDFCYFKVYTDKNSKEIKRYLSAVVSELEAIVDRPYLRARHPRFVYFGGGTPSYLSADQLRWLLGELEQLLPFDEVEELTFECEPGTLSLPKIEALKEVGVTRLSLGVENFDPDILELNNRAHRAAEIHRTYGWMRDVGFDQVNIDLIAGMVGETDANWSDCVEKTIQMAPESVTIYQMEVPYNTTIYARMKEDGSEAAPVADWDTKRRWTAEAFERMRAAGYHQSSAYTVCKPGTGFVYRDALWHGADMLGLGVSSFSHLAGVHFQNEPSFEPYITRVEAGEAPIARAYDLSDEERLIRELVLQLKTGSIDAAEFRSRFGVDVLERFREPLEEHRRAGMLELEGTLIRTTPEGLLRVDSLLPPFFLEEHRNARYA